MVINMKRKWIALVVLIISFLFAVCLLAVLLVHKKNNDESVSYTKKQVSLENIKSDETVLAMRYQNDAWGHVDQVLVINKNKQLKFIDLSNEKMANKIITRKDLLHFFDEKLHDKDIAFKKEQLTISNEMLSEIININDYKLEQAVCSGADRGEYAFYSVCGSGSNRNVVVMKIEGDRELKCNNKKINSLCDAINELF